MSVLPPLSEDDELLVAELAFGLLDPDARAAAEERLASSPAFAAHHRLWLKHAVTLIADRDEAPGPAVWDAIVASLPANENPPREDDPRTSLRFWRAATALSAAAALVLAVVAVERKPVPAPVAPPPVIAAAAPLVAVLAGKGRPVVTISFDRASGRLISAPSGLDLHGRSPELWVIPADGTPRSLGLIAATAPGVTHAPAAANLIAAGTTLAISVEPRGGSPTGLPTGPVILTGKVVTI